MNYNHFVTKQFISHGQYLNDTDYAKVLDNVVIAVVDCVLINYGKEILLGKRTREPWPNWWMIGGRMKPGESFEQTAARNVKRELTLDIDPARFIYVGCYSMVWGMRAQAPQENGCHTLSVTMMLRVSEDETRQIMPNDEYHELKWIKLADAEKDGDLHPALHKIISDTEQAFLGRGVARS